MIRVEKDISLFHRELKYSLEKGGRLEGRSEGAGVVVSEEPTADCQ